MTLRMQVLVWVGFSLVTILVLWVFRSILLPFVIGIALAYLLNPLVNWLQAPDQPGLGDNDRAAHRARDHRRVLPDVWCRWSATRSSASSGACRATSATCSGSCRILRHSLPTWLGEERAAQLEGSLTDLHRARRRARRRSITAAIAANGLNVDQHHRGTVHRPGRRLLPAARLGRHGQAGRRPAAARVRRRDPRRAARDRPLDGRRDPRAGLGDPRALHLLRTALSLVGLNFGLAIGIYRWPAELHPVRRLPHRLRAVDGGLAGAVLARPGCWSSSSSWSTWSASSSRATSSIQSSSGRASTSIRSG